MSTFTAKDREEVNKAADEPDGDLAAAIDQAVNNTSLVTMIEVGGQFLLFPGDAQWGTWKAILDDADGRRLLEHTTMLKVSHHGSHNGTPKELVEKLLQKGTVALVSTEPVKQWPDVPRAPLMKALAAQAILARSDKATKVKGQAGFTVEESYVVWETLVPS
jgi:beta-lactamase superfamily II metal-dependent hydrolase